jgi:hypothetical protein
VTRRRILLVVLALACACAGQAPQSAYLNRDIRRNEILMLDGKILDYRKELGLEPRPSSWLIQQMHGVRIVPPPPASRSGAPCADVCDLAEYICRAQQDICRIADELGEDDWARGKCDSAKASCTEAKKRCTDCPAPNSRPAVP